jgi:hypothetical protein
MSMRALSIRQPYAELILRGIKTIEYRSRSTSIIGERFLIYASRTSGQKIWSNDLATMGEAPMPQWMIELAEQAGMIEREVLARGTRLPTGVIVGSAVIEEVKKVGGWPRRAGIGRQGNSDSSLAANNDQLTAIYEWHLSKVERATTLRKPKKHPQPVWFRPF